MKKFLCFVLTLAMVLPLVSCRSSTNPGGSPTNSSGNDNPNNAVEIAKDVTVGITTDPVNLAPWAARSPGRFGVLFNIYQVLAPCIVDPDSGEFKSWNVMMSGMDHEPGSSSYVIHIREGIHDTLGNKIDAYDVKFSYEQCDAMGNSNDTKAIEEINVIDPYTIEFIVNSEMLTGQFEDVLSIFIVSQASYEASPDGMQTTPVGSTGYELFEYVPGSHLTITKSDTEYWNAASNKSKNVEDGYCYLYETDNVDNVRFEFITDTTTMAVALETNSIDMSGSVAPADISMFKDGGINADKFDVWNFPASQVELRVNCDASSPMSNINLREAVFRCFDNESILQIAYDGEGEIAYSWDSPHRGDYNPKYESLPYFEYDMNVAAEYLNKYYEETGATASDVHLVILTSSGEEYPKVAQIIQSKFCELVGSDEAMEVVVLDTNSFTTTYADPTAFDLIVNGNASESTHSTTAWYKDMLASAQSNGMAGYFIDDPKLQELLYAAASEATHSQETCDAFNDYIIEKAYRKAICNGYTHMVCATWVEQILKGPKACIAVCGMHYNWDLKAQLDM